MDDKYLNEDKEKLIKIIDENKDIFIEASMHIWENPELSMQEYEASRSLSKLLEDNGFDVELGVADIPTAFVATYGKGDPVIGFSSEYDALPGLSQKNDSNTKEPITPFAPGHGCGHNLLALGGVQAAVALKKLMEEKGLKGTIKVFGTPAEELCIGKPYMARAGLFDGLDAVVDWHPANFNSPGYCDTNAYFNVKYHFYGKNAHGNAPWMGISALDSSMLMGHALEILREHIRPGTETSPSTLNYVFPDVGNSFPNVVPAKSTIWIVGRLKDAEMAADVMKRVRNCAYGCAQATGTTVEEEVITATHDMIPNRELSLAIEKNFEIVGTVDYSEKDEIDAKEVQKAVGCEVTGYDRSVMKPKEGSMPVTDSSEYSWYAPVGFFNLALCPSIETAGHSWSVCKFAGSEVGMKTMVTSSKLLALTAYDALTDKALLDRAKKELETRLGNRKYKTLLPEDAKPDLDTNKDIMEKFKK